MQAYHTAWYVRTLMRWTVASLRFSSLSLSTHVKMNIFFLNLFFYIWIIINDIDSKTSVWEGARTRKTCDQRKKWEWVCECVCSWKRVRENGHLNSTMACWLYSILQLYSTSVCFYIFCIQLVRYSFACLPLLCNAMLCMCLCWWHKSSLIITHLNIE